MTVAMRTLLAVLAGSALLGGCRAALPPLEPVAEVDLQRFMGDWYVIANIPTFVEKGAHNAVETYRLDEDGSIATTFTFRKGNFDGAEKSYHPRGFVEEGTGNAIWGMQFIWPIKGDYRITWLADDYSSTVISRNKRDYVWIMARTPQVSEQVYQEMLQHVRESGYDLEQIRKVPQKWQP